MEPRAEIKMLSSKKRSLPTSEKNPKTRVVLAPKDRDRQLSQKICLSEVTLKLAQDFEKFLHRDGILQFMDQKGASVVHETWFAAICEKLRTMMRSQPGLKFANYYVCFFEANIEKKNWEQVTFVWNIYSADLLAKNDFITRLGRLDPQLPETRGLGVHASKKLGTILVKRNVRMDQYPSGVVSGIYCMCG